MRCDVQLLDSKGESWFDGSRELPADYILKLSAKRKPAVMEKGLEFAQGAIPFFGAELVKVVKANSSEDVIDKAVIELALATVVVESCMGIEDEVLANRHLRLTVHADGAVRYDRIDMQP
ncbi:MAG: hypothetical protein ACN6Q5_22410 [Pseudomonas sp.]|uniref:hypothetical protein n=1 Tax=Pseudomonas sp. TaxID=306 RepID=UPI003D106734